MDLQLFQRSGFFWIIATWGSILLPMFGHARFGIPTEPSDAPAFFANDCIYGRRGVKLRFLYYVCVSFLSLGSERTGRVRSCVMIPMDRRFAGDRKRSRFKSFTWLLFVTDGFSQPCCPETAGDRSTSVHALLHLTRFPSSPLIVGMLLLFEEKKKKIGSAHMWRAATPDQKVRPLRTAR